MNAIPPERGLKVDVSDVARYLRTGGEPLEGALARRVEELSAAASNEIRPARTWRRFAVTDGAVSSGNVKMPVFGTLARHLAGCNDVYLACATLGARFDAFQRRIAVTSGADAFILQAVGAAMIEKLMDSVEDGIRAELASGEALTVRYSPGYGDFPLSAQRDILSLLDACRRVGVSLTDTLLMTPSKSVSAVIGVTVQ